MVNSDLKVHPPMQIEHIAIYRFVGGNGQQPILRPDIACFSSDAVYKSIFNQKRCNENHRDSMIFIIEDLTVCVAVLARITRTLKKEHQLSNCWTPGGNVMVKELDNIMRETGVLK